MIRQHTLERGLLENPIEMIREDHEEIRDLFRQYQEQNIKAITRRKGIADKIFREIEIHALLEEEVFYPTAEVAVGPVNKELIDEAREGHAEIKDLLQELRELDPGTEEFDLKMNKLLGGIEHHIEEEETELLPLAEEHLGEELTRIGREMYALRNELFATYDQD